MAAEERGAGPQNVILESRKRLSVSGVESVEGFDESYVRTKTRLGTLLIEGEGLHVDLLSVDSGDLLVTGEIDAVSYERPPERRGLWGRLMG